MSSGHADYAPDITFPLTIQQGGTGAITLTANGVLIGNGTSPVTAVTGTDGQVLQVNAAGAPVFQSFDPLAITYPFTLSPPAAKVGEIIQLAASPTQDAFQVKSSTGALVFRVEAFGECHAISQAPANVPFVAILASGQTADAMQVQDSLNNPLFEITAGGSLIIEPSDPTWIGLVVKGAATPTHDLAQFKDNASNILIEFGKTGQVTLAPVDTATIPLVIKAAAGATTSLLVIDDNSLHELFGVDKNGATLINPTVATTIPLTLKFPALNTASAFEIQDSLANVLAGFGADGQLTITPQQAATIPLVLKLAASANQNAFQIKDSSSNLLINVGVNGQTVINPTSASVVPLVLKLAASPTVDAFQVHDSLGNNLFEVTDLGNITWPGTLTSTGAVAINAGGTNQSITLTPSGTGFTILNGKVGVNTTNPNNQFVVSNAGAAGLEVAPGVNSFGLTNVVYVTSFDRSLSAYVDLVFDTGASVGPTLLLTSAGEARVYSLFSVGGSDQFQINASGKCTNYNGNATVVDGLPAILATVSRAGITANVGSTNILTPPAAGIYRVSVYCVVTTPGTAGTIEVDIGWTDDVQAQDKAVFTIADMPAGTFGEATLVISAKPPGTIAYAVTFSGVTGTPACSLYIRVEKIG